MADALHRVVDPLARQLGRDVAGLIRHFGTQEDAALGELHARLDRALADRGDGRDEAPVAVAQAYLAAGDTANALATKQSRKLSAFGKDFASRFSPSAGGFTRASQKAKESFHKVLGFFGTGQSHAEVARARSAALTQLKEDYLTQLPGHIDYLVQSLAIEATAMTALESVATDLEPILAREAAHVKELVEWRKVELQVERVREHTANAHERAEILEMRKTTRALLGEAERNAETLALALRPGAAMEQAA